VAQHEIVELSWLSAVPTCNPIERRWEGLVLRVADGAVQDRLVHGPDAIAGADARRWDSFEPNDIGERLKAPRPRHVQRLTRGNGPSGGPQRQQAAAGKLVRRQRLDRLERHYSVVGIRAFFGAGVGVVFEIPWRISHDDVVAGTSRACRIAMQPSRLASVRAAAYGRWRETPGTMNGAGRRAKPPVVPFARAREGAPPGTDGQLDKAGQTILQLVAQAAGRADENSRHALGTAQQLSDQLRAAEDRVAELESELAAYQERAERAEQWLHRIYGEIEDRFLQQGDSRRPVNGSSQRSQNQRRSR
jgi:hypothetical protein